MIFRAPEPDVVIPDVALTPFLFERTASRLMEMRSEAYVTERLSRKAEPSSPDAAGTAAQ